MKTQNASTPKASGFRQPAEWEPHAACWLAWPSHAELWREDLGAAEAEFTAMAAAIAANGKGERLEVLVPDREAGARAETSLRGLPVRLHLLAFGDIWLRDTAPIFCKNERGEVAAVRFRFNGWGGKYIMEGDENVAVRITEIAGARRFDMPWILEGGGVEVDGEGSCLTSRQCLLNPNRNPGMNQVEIEEALRQSLGVEKILWVSEGLRNDHTDGHIDTIARFVAPATVVCMEAQGPDDPNRAVLERIKGELQSMRDAKGRPLKVITIPSPGPVRDSDGEIMPASYVNFYIGNATVVVPTYGTPWDEAAVREIGACFPGRRTVGLSARAILGGGGAFHCISQQQPS